MAAKKKTGAFEGDGAERFFSLGNIPKQKLTKKQQKAVDAMNKYLEEICSGGRKKPGAVGDLVDHLKEVGDL
ncbi:MAG: hypothetical protein ACSW8A_09650 [Lachnospiraceae bacterium]